MSSNSLSRAVFLLSLILAAGCKFQNTGVGFPSLALLNSPTAIFLAEGATSKSLGALQLFEVLDDGTIQAVPFYDDEGNQVQLSIQNLYHIGNQYIGVVFLIGYSQYSVVIDIADGKIYDFSSYDILGAFFQNGYLYVGRWTDLTLYKVDFVERIAVPINNPEYDPFDGNKHVFVTPADLIYVSSYAGTSKIFFPDNRPPLSTTYYEFCCGEWPALQWRSTFVTPSYSIWTVFHSGVATSNSYRRTIIDETGITYSDSIVYGNPGAGELLDVHWVNATMNDARRFILYSNGYFKVSVVADELSVSYTSKTFPSNIRKNLGTIGSTGYLSGTKVFIQEGNAIKYMDIVSDSGFSTMLESVDLIKWNVLCENTVVYSEYITATDVATYQLVIGSSPKLISYSTMEIQDVIEFSLP